ncbi:MAG: hypothetical protein RIM23_22870 [Coleofasciculus sp. G3-WIS-01]|uniref:hypothetical protein n=1 Tax=Coleofasciculus sp. G3-WIS-01 TaxID=3069528 RepID=UPI0032FC9600
MINVAVLHSIQLRAGLGNTGVAQLKWRDRFDGEIGRTPCAPTMLIQQIRFATPLQSVIGEITEQQNPPLCLNLTPLELNRL